MQVLRRLVPLALVAAMLGSVALVSAAASAETPATATLKGKAKGKKCPKGKKAVTVKRNGKSVKVCKKKKNNGGCVKRARLSATASCTPPPPPPPPCSPTTSPPCFFPDPGKTLEGDEAKNYLKPYLPNSVFTDCVPGWPACGGFENRYSHWADATFYKCLLRPTSGSDVKSVGEYGVIKAQVNPDGSFIFQEVISWYSELTYFEWQVADNGVVNGAVQSHPGETPEKIGPLQYVPNVAKDCSY